MSSNVNWKQPGKAAIAGAAAGLLGASNVAAQSRLDTLRDRFWGDDTGETDIASAGSGGVATSSASGGAVGIGDVNSGGNAGNAIGVGDTVGTVGVDGGLVANTTDLGVTASGGTAISDASGGNYNLAFVS
jgi:hypothetical protein